LPLVGEVRGQSSGARRAAAATETAALFGGWVADGLDVGRLVGYIYIVQGPQEAQVWTPG
jgi:hypothetical protein